MKQKIDEILKPAILAELSVVRSMYTTYFPIKIGKYVFDPQKIWIEETIMKSRKKHKITLGSCEYFRDNFRGRF